MFEAVTLDPFSEKSIAAEADFSIDDYGKDNSGPYQVVMPTYNAPVWLKQFAALGPALRECSTLCTLRGVPFRVVRWGREGSGANGGIPCATCAKTTPNTAARFPRRVHIPGTRRRKRGPGYIKGFPDAHPIAEYRPNGQRLVYNNQGVAQLVGRPNYVISHNPFPRTYKPTVYPQRYLEAVHAAQALANGWGDRMFVVDKTKRVPVGYVDPVSKAHPTPTDKEKGAVMQVTVNPVSPEYFQQLVAQSEGRNYLGQGA